MLRPMGRQARGVKAISLREGDCVVGMCVVANDDLILTASETGFGRISNVSDYRLQSRGGKGITNYHTEKEPEMLRLSVRLSLTRILSLFRRRAKLSELPPILYWNRPSKGVTLMRIGENDKEMNVARAPHEDSESEKTRGNSRRRNFRGDTAPETNAEENTEE